MQPPIKIITFYKFVRLPDYADWQQPLLDLCNQHGIRGTILLAEEGINSTVAGTHDGIHALLDYLHNESRFADLLHKASYADFIPFDRMKVRLKKEIVTLKAGAIDPNEGVGEYVEPQDWNALIADPDVLVIDTRNDFEIDIGSFKGAIRPDTDSFHEFPDFVQRNLDPARNQKIAMFCTGGIRCEKATAYMLQQGFQQVYHLNGGILRYLETVAPDQSLWEGECFVFDQRVSVDHQLQPGKARFCDRCGHLLVDEQQPCPTCDSN